MAKKKTELQELSEFIRGHMATKADITELRIELKGDIAGIRKDMLTKDNLAKLDVKIDRLDLSIHRELESIKEQLKNVAGFGKEIDHALERIAAIEKHLGIDKKIAA
jgi:hypothetical protein